MKKIALALSIAGSLLLADNAVLSKDGLGDFLIAPVYFAKNNVCTKVTVYNTNTTHSILAKVAFREKLRSNEVDLPIFLSPGDVWSGEVCQKNNDVYLYSDDDSNHPKIYGILSTTGKDLTAQSIKAGNSNVDFTTGYIEVYPIAEFNENSDKKVDKEILVKRWDSLIQGKIPSNTLKTGVDGYSLSGNVAYEANGEVSTILPMVAFKGTHDKTLTGSAIAYGNDTSPEVLLGYNKKTQLLKIMQHKKIAFTYTNYGKNQYIVFTYPFSYAEDQEREFKFVVRDMSENKDEKKKEVVIFSPAPKPKTIKYTMKNEVAIISVEDLINKTKNPSMYKDGQIQIENIKNLNNVQLGVGKEASFIATYITIDPKTGKVINAYYTPTK